MRDHAGALVRAGRTARRIGRRDDRDDAVIGHGVDLLAQQFELRRVRGPGMRRLRRGGFAVAGERIEAQFDAGREHQPVVGSVSPVESVTLRACASTAVAVAIATLMPAAAILS